MISIRRFLPHRAASPPAAPLPLPLAQRQLVIGLGAMKSGTTWLSRYLAAHPQFFHSPIKETNIFASLYPDNPAIPEYVYRPDDAYRLRRMEDMILASGTNPAGFDLSEFDRARFDRLRALAQIGRIRKVGDYMSFFGDRIGAEMHFGEISPSYAHLPPEAYRVMAGLSGDVRFLFLMRDPTDRAGSHLRHWRRRVYSDVSLDKLLQSVDRHSPIYIRSDYRYTLQTLRSLGLEGQSRFLFYEELFTQQCMDDLCAWLGLDPQPADCENRRNPGVGDSLSHDQIALLRDRLSPIYEELCTDPVAGAARAWRW